MKKSSADYAKHFNDTYLLMQVYLLRKYTSHKIPEKGLRFYLCTLSSETVVYKVSGIGLVLQVGGVH